jgi:flagellar basal-body rod protein FlgF
METHANNMANVGTAGYKNDSIQFEEYLMPKARITPLSGRDARLSYVQDTYMLRNFSQGPVEQSGNELDVAINGDGFMVVETPDGERYTRNGQLKLNNEGIIVTSEGFPVLGDGGPITIGAEESGLTIAKDGTISTSDGLKGSLRLVQFADNQELKKQGTTLFSTMQAPEPAGSVEVMQGSYEKSNVQPIIELNRMLETVRTYTASANTFKTMQDLRREAINQLGKLSSS